MEPQIPDNRKNDGPKSGVILAE